MRLGDTVDFFTAPSSRPRPAQVVKKWSESMVNVVVLLDGMNDAEDFGSREIEHCTAHRSTVPIVAAGKPPPIGQFCRERDPAAA